MQPVPYTGEQPTPESTEPVTLARIDTPAAPGYPVPLTGQTPAAVQPSGEPVVFVPDAWGRMVPMPRSQVPALPEPTPPRDLTPGPLIDPRAQITLAAGIGAGAGLGWGIGQAAAGIAAISGSSAVLVLAALLLLAKAPRSSKGGKASPLPGTEVHFHRGSRVRVRHLHNG
ncbi:hypothetical protein [Streptomyces aidingensis]|uniref:Uncharacterized protein n=1 Tax=Streptomyces aidingensis TaxID=910347 RepID=A0A1I1UUC0_9ACTN|nr:hypothetical protein [Streptomyces aidingensis]SFD74422.1 hypothetical protein SAMN05421773_12719 [Streptomyces aidingensis]